MSARQLAAIAAGVAVLLLLWGTSELLTRRSDTTTGDLRLPTLAVGDVDTVAITRGADTVLLVKRSPTAWTVNGWQASQAAIGELFQSLRDSSTPELAAQSASSFARMGVDSSAGRLLRVAGGGKTLARLILGGHGPDYDATYMRLPGDAHVYLWRGRLPTLAARAAEQWRDHEIAAVAPDSIAAVEIRRARESYALRKQGKKWLLPGGAPADSATVARLLDRFRTVTASGFATERQADSLRFDRPRRLLTLSAGGRRQLLALAFDSTAGGFWVRRASGGTVYRLDTWQVDQLTPALQTLQPKAK